MAEHRFNTAQPLVSNLNREEDCPAEETNEIAEELGAPNDRISEAVCIDAARVFDSCADKDCLADLRVYFTDCAQPIIDAATSIRCRKAEIITCYVDVESVPFNKGFYSVDMTFFFRISLDAYSVPMAPPVTVEGLSVFSKKCILYGSEGSVKVYTSEYIPDDFDEQFTPVNTNPKAKVQAVDPICLNAKVCEIKCCEPCCAPANICKCFKGDFSCVNPTKGVYVTLGLFTIVELERDVQMLMPAYDYCIPEKECCFSADDPCDIFRQIKFPLGQFFPSRDASVDDDMPNCGCGCGK